MKNLDAYIAHILADFRNFFGEPKDDVQRQVREKMIEKHKIELEYGSKYLKVVTNTGGQRSVHSFICLKDNGKFKTGDILKAASWAAPAKNFARGNLLEGKFSNVRWTGA